MSNSERWIPGDGSPGFERGAVYDENRLPVAYVCGQSEDDSDTHLIAAAPAMLAALNEGASAAREVVACWERGDLAGAVSCLEGWADSAQTTIDSAEGR